MLVPVRGKRGTGKMGQSIVKRVIQLLNQGGVPADYAQPEGKMINILLPVAAVSIQQIDQAKQEATVRVEIAAMAADGGYRCENTAMKAYELLRSDGAVCQLHRCTFSGRLGMFSMPLLATFARDAYQQDWKPQETPQHRFSVAVEEQTLPHVTQFTASQAVTDADTEELSDMPWNFTVEEWIPAGEQAPDNPVGLFEMTVTTDRTREGFEGCCMTSLQRQVEKTGIKQLRKGIAVLRTVETIT